MKIFANNIYNSPKIANNHLFKKIQKINIKTFKIFLKMIKNIVFIMKIYF